jgi:glutathione synthase
VSQAFLPRITAGDKRIFFIGGDVAGAFVRIPKHGSYIANIAQGGSIHRTTITPREEELARLLGPKLVERGIYICGIDVIDDHVTEVNITSSVGFSQIEELYGEKPQIALWDFIEKTA